MVRYPKGFNPLKSRNDFITIRQQQRIREMVEAVEPTKPAPATKAVENENEETE